MDHAPACTASSLDAGESMWGTAPEAKRFVLLEVRGKWARKPLDTELPKRLVEWLRDTDADKATRLGFIRRPRCAGPLSLYVVDTEQDLSLRFELERASDAVGIDVPSVFRHGGHIGAGETQQPMVLVCTHGRRDVCCAKLGMPLYDALCREPGLDVWQTTHLGGHRFAPVVATLPNALSYGRVPVQRAAEFAAAVREARVFDAQHLRGPMTQPSHVQAAMCAQWASTPRARLALHESSEDPHSPGGVVVSLNVDGDIRRHIVHGRTLDGVHKSCGAEAGSVPCYDVHPAPAP